MSRSGKEISSYSPKEIFGFLDDLRRVGKDKPLGYLPLSTLRDICHVDPNIMSSELRARGLKVMEVDDARSNVFGGALYAYDEESLKQVLQSGRSILEKNGWPTEPREFVLQLGVFAEDPDLYNLIMIAFADPRLKTKNKLKQNT